MAFWKKAAPPRTHTNAPRHWPEVVFAQHENIWVNTVMLAGSLTDLLKPPSSTMALVQSFVYEDGILQVPIVVTEEGRKTCVFVYSSEQADAAAHYSGVRALLRTRENATAVFYGPEAFTPVAPAQVLQPIDTPMFSKPEGSRDARFALWWSSPEDPSFTASPDRALLDRWFEALDGYGYLLFSAFVNDLDLIDKEQQKTLYGLPAQPFLHPLTGPGSTDVLLYASVPEGAFLGFDLERVAAKRRHVMLKLLSDFAAKYRSAIDAKKVPPRTEERGLAAWRAARDEAIAREAAGSTELAIHSVEIADGQPRRTPGVSSAADRAAQPAMPGRELLDFAMDLIDRAIARMRRKPVTPSSQEQLGMPNLFPTIVARVDGRVWEREVAYEDAAMSLAAAGRILDEWPSADMAAFMTDAAIRENDQRVDVVHVTVQNMKDGVAAAMYQRYRTSASGTIELIGRPTATPEKPFVQPASPPPPGAHGDPDAALMALIQQALTTIGQTQSPPKPEDDIGDPVTMPSAMIESNQDRGTLARFAMQGPLTAAGSCVQLLRKEAATATAVVYWFDDLRHVDGVPDRRLRFCACRRGDPATAIVDQRFETPEAGKPFALKGRPEFKRWASPLFS